MNIRLYALLLYALGASSYPLGASFAALSSNFLLGQEPRKPSFDEQIAPILAQRCLSCHSGEDAKAHLDLSRRDSAMKGGESGIAIEPRNPEASLLWKQIANDDMPPKKPLTPAEKKSIRDWIEQGADWGSDPIDPFRFTTQDRAGLDWWSLQPLSKSAPPKKAPEEHPIDAFLEQPLHAARLAFSRVADKSTLIRRVTFDLIGLPPTPQEVQAFLSDERPNAYEELVSRLLQSPHYGERWARHWLDLVRFGESNGFEYDEPRNNAWHYRNWVIDALNQDMPYDEFARQQIAGDAFHPNTFAASAALGFLVAGPHNTTLPSNDKMRMEMAQEELEDLVGTVCQTFLGLTAQCARCHEHKFDPISHKEYYQLAAALAGVSHGELKIKVPFTPSEQSRLESLTLSIADLELQIEDRLAPTREAIRVERSKNVDRAIASTPAVQPYASWEFEGNFDDSMGRLPARPIGNARIESGALVLDGKDAFAQTDPLPMAIAEKTLEAWVQLPNLDQRGGGVLSIQTRDGAFFDAIVFGEREPRMWMAGSNHFARTQPLHGSLESEAEKRPVAMAIVYKKDGTIEAYRDGVPYGQAYKVNALQTYEPQKSHIVFGLRHAPAGGNRMLAGRILRAQFYDRALNAEEIARSAAWADHSFVSPSSVMERLSDKERSTVERLQAELEKHRQQRKELMGREERTLYTNISKAPKPTFVLARGEVSKPGEEVQPNGLRAIATASYRFDLTKEAGDPERRRKLAEWITSPDNPLFLRVIVNRLWHYHFGAGLVSTPSDFGYNGGRPTHPELLDWLASELVRKQYSLKEIHRTIVTSHAYKQSSDWNATAAQRDADNRLLWRKSPVRLEAESIRDAALAIAGKLQSEIGGVGYRDVEHVFYKGSHFYGSIDEAGSLDRRRTIYRFNPRGGRNPFLDTFDCPDPSATTPKRAATTTPLQSLTLMNNPFVFQIAEDLATRIQSESGVDPFQQSALLYQLAYGRKPSMEEQITARDFIQEHSLALFCRVILNSNEFLYVR